jgi:PiT family inorganic phosphate transporter
VGKRGAQVRWATAGRMAVAWVITLPAAAIVGAVCWYLAHGIGGATGVAVVFAVLLVAAGLIFRHSRKTPVSHDNVNAEWEGGLAPAQPQPARRATADLSA